MIGRIHSNPTVIPAPAVPFVIITCYWCFSLNDICLSLLMYCMLMTCCGDDGHDCFAITNYNNKSYSSWWWLFCCFGVMLDILNQHCVGLLIIAVADITIKMVVILLSSLLLIVMDLDDCSTVFCCWCSTVGNLVQYIIVCNNVDVAIIIAIIHFSLRCISAIFLMLHADDISDADDDRHSCVCHFISLNMHIR